MPTPEQNEIHYHLEKELAATILAATPAERATVAKAAYDELFRRLPWHPGHLRTSESRAFSDLTYAPFLRLAGTGNDVLEIGCGDGRYTRRLARTSRRCVGIDVSGEILDPRPDDPPNLEFVVSDAVHLDDIDDHAFDIAFSKQLLEHLHPDDLRPHLHAVHRVLRPGGLYVVQTPNRLTGPHDITRLHDDVARGFHLREYTNSEMLAFLSEAGFGRFRSPLFRNRMYRRAGWLARRCEPPTSWKRLLEACGRYWPVAVRRRLDPVFDVFIVARA